MRGQYKDRIRQKLAQEQYSDLKNQSPKSIVQRQDYTTIILEGKEVKVPTMQFVANLEMKLTEALRKINALQEKLAIVSSHTRENARAIDTKQDKFIKKYSE